jgi:chemotaxis protein histidine kinase CheA
MPVFVSTKLTPNRSLEKAYRKMLVDQLRVAQHGIRGSAQKKGRDLTDRFRGTLHILEKLVRAIGNSKVKAAENLARELIRRQVIVFRKSCGRD